MFAKEEEKFRWREGGKGNKKELLLTKSISCDSRKPNLTKTVSVLLLTGRISRLYVLNRSSYKRLASGLHFVTRMHWNSSIRLKKMLLPFISISFVSLNNTHSVNSIYLLNRQKYFHKKMSFFLFSIERNFKKPPFPIIHTKCNFVNKYFVFVKISFTFSSVRWDRTVSPPFWFHSDRKWYWANFVLVVKSARNGASFHSASTFFLFSRCSSLFKDTEIPYRKMSLRSCVFLSFLSHSLSGLLMMVNRLDGAVVVIKLHPHVK